MDTQTQKPTKAPAPPPIMWTVHDLNARTERRVHEPVLGTRYSLSAAEPTEMPRAHALKFLCDVAYVVKDENGAVVNPLPKVELTPINGGVILRADQVAAGIEELTTPALVARCAAYPETGALVDRGNRDEMIKFLFDKNVARQQHARRALVSGGGDGFEDLEEISDETLSRMLPRNAA